MAEQPHPCWAFIYWHGAAYVFVRAGINWTSTTETAKLAPSDGDANDSFGFVVAISGDNIVIGAYTANVGSNAEQGAAYLLSHSRAGRARHKRRNSPLQMAPRTITLLCRSGSAGDGDYDASDSAGVAHTVQNGGSGIYLPLLRR